MVMLDSLRDAQRIVLKLGSAIITENGKVRRDWLEALAQDIHDHFQDKDVLIVSSGAIALGRNTLNIGATTPGAAVKVELKQATAALGQMTLMSAFSEVFAAQDRQVAQILLSPSDTENRRTHLNARSTLLTLLERGILPVINENDTTATEEIRFGDNDRLAARVAQMVEADLLLILSTTDGLYTDNPGFNPNASHIPLVKEITEDYIKIAGDAPAGISSGGMKSKIQAAQIAVNAGCSVIVTGGNDVHPITAMVEKQQRATFFPAGDTPHNARKRWIEAHLNVKGRIYIDDGAATALKEGKSLLPVGVVEVDGVFDRGDVVRIFDKDGAKLGVGLISFDSVEAQKLIGVRGPEIESALGYAGREVLIHRDDMVLDRTY